MGLAYVFALVVGLGILLVQAVLGSSKDADHDHAGHDHAGHDHAGHDHAGHDHDHDHAHDVDHDDPDEGDAGEGGIVAMFLSTRFWIFAALGFGLSGTLLTYLFGGAFLPTLLTAAGLGLASGFLAAFTYQFLRRQASRPTEHTASAAGRIARVLVPIDGQKKGQIRIELGGQTVDLPARSDGARIERGDLVVIEEVEGEVAVVSAAPEEIKASGQ